MGDPSSVTSGIAISLAFTSGEHGRVHACTDYAVWVTGPPPRSRTSHGSSRTPAKPPRSRRPSPGRPSTARSDTRATESRDERKARTRRALLDAALGLLEDEAFSSLSLREVAREAGIVPTAFYRHFHDMDELGLALVAESVGSLHDLLNAARRGVIAQAHLVRPSLEILHEHVRAHPSHFRFVARERSGGSPALRHTIRREIKLFATELAVDLARDPRQSTWPTADIQMLADLLVTVIVSTIESLLEVDPAQSEDAQEVMDVAAAQMTVVLLGSLAWKPATPPTR